MSALALLAGLGLAPDALAGTGSLDMTDKELHLTVLFNYLPAPVELEMIENTMNEVSAVLCDVTDGNLRIGTVKVRANECAGVGCQTSYDEADVVIGFSNNPGAAAANVCLGHNDPCIELGQNGSNATLSRYYLEQPVIFAHELAHLVLNLSDGYAVGDCQDHRPRYGEMFSCEAMESGDGTVTSLMMANICGFDSSDQDIYTEFTTASTKPDLGQDMCAAAVDCDASAFCDNFDYDSEYDGYHNETADTIPICNAFDPDSCQYAWPGSFWWSQYTFGAVFSEWEQIALTLQAVNGGDPYFTSIPGGAPNVGVPASRAAFCGVPPQIDMEVDLPDQVMLVVDRSWSMAFPDSQYEKCPPGGCLEVCANGADDDKDGAIDEVGCKASRMDTLKTMSLIWLDLLAASEEKIETGVLSFACDTDPEVPFTVPTTASVAATYAPAINALSPNGGTAIVDALYEADSQLDGASKAVFLLTDGFTSCGDDDVPAAIDALVANNTRVFPISFGPSYASPETMEIANGTNGRYLGVEETNELGPALARQWAHFVAAGQTIPQLPYRLNRQASHSGPIKTPESWLDDAPPAALPYPGVEIFDVWAEQGTSKLMVLLASDHEDLSTFGMRAKLLGPAGSKPSSYDTTIASPLLKVVRRKGYMLLELKTPNPGKWQIQLNVPNIAGVTAQQSGYITVLNRSPNARLATDISRTVVSQPGQPVVVRAYPRWASSNLFGANVEANLVAPDGLVTPLTVEGGDDPTTAYRVHVPPWAIDMQGLFEVRLRVVAAPGTARLSEGEWLPDVPMPVSYVRTASESFVVLPGGCGTPNCGQ